MGLAGNNPLSLILILFIILLVFGTGKLKSLGSDLGEALKQFKRSLRDEDETPSS